MTTPILLTPDETAALLRTSRKAIYAMTGESVAGVTRIGRRVLYRRDALVDWSTRSARRRWRSRTAMSVDPPTAGAGKWTCT